MSNKHTFDTNDSIKEGSKQKNRISKHIYLNFKFIKGEEHEKGKLKRKREIAYQTHYFKAEPDINIIYGRYINIYA